MANNVAGHGRLRVAGVVILLLALAPVACRRYADHLPDLPKPTAKYPITVANPLPTGGVRGRVVWAGDRPSVEPIRGLIAGPDGPQWGEAANPFAPRIDPAGGVGGAVVWLEGVNPTKLKPWPHPPLRVEQTTARLSVVQGRETGGVGFVRVGDEVEMVSKEAVHHQLRGRGAAYFTLAFLDPNQPLKRSLDTPGVVEFSSAAGYFWTAADVFVCDHPYYATTDAAGRFELANVPPGEYRLHARVRNWEITGRDRDPESGKIARLHFAEPWRITKPVAVTDGRTSETELTLP